MIAVAAAVAMGARATDITDELATKIVADQLPDGALRMSARNAGVRVVPYFSNLAAIALLQTNNPAYRETVRKWITWYAANQEEDGTIYDFTGKVGAYAKSDKRDSTDSYAATYLQVLWRYWQVVGEEGFPTAFRTAATRALDAITLTIDPADGLTWAKPEYKVKYLMDNLEVCIGLEEGAKLFTAIGEPVLANNALQARQRILRSLGPWWDAEKGYFAWARGSSGAFHVGFDRWYPDGLIHLFALSVLQVPPPGLWEKVNARFGREEKLTPDWWLRAAKVAGTPEQIARYTAATEKYAAELVAKNGEINRLATTLLALAEAPGQRSTVELTVLLK